MYSTDRQKSNAAHRLVLGTAQFGMTYGVANHRGKPTTADITEILTAARSAGLTTLDTATAYGESEARLGGVGMIDWKVISKVPSLKNVHTDQLADRVDQYVRASCKQLGVERLHGVLLHDPTDAVGERGRVAKRALMALRDRNVSEKIGLSIYRPSDLNHALEDFQPDIVQAPVNLLDQRMLDPSVSEKLGAINCELHARSAFLQGLLLMPAEKRPRYFDSWKEELQRVDELPSQCGVSALGTCIGFVASRPEVSKVVVGVDSAEQLEQIIEAFRDVPHLPNFGAIKSSDPALIEPVRWPAV